LEREIIQTLDGSTTIHLKEWDECYHSKHGAIQEAKHVFIQNGLSLFPNQSVSILEIGFGTGLNAFITFIESQKLHQSIHYVGVEAYPVNAAEVLAMNYVTELNAISDEALFKKMHESNWDEKVVLHPEFELITYAARGVVKRSMIEVGFTVEKLPGPPGKREMFRASKAIESV
jgi:tRNA U34 5-methylaminomethyl-2-thiouridine-forming methyltransferase MnmC